MAVEWDPAAGTGTGHLAFLLTDVEGSARLWEQDPDGMSAALSRHDAIIEATASTWRGRVIKRQGEGDSAFLVFGTAAEAVSCALHLQRALLDEAWPSAGPLRVRVAVAAGPVEIRDGDYYGPAVNRAARLRALAHGAQVLITGDAAGAARGALPPEAALRDLGTHRLRDLARPERIFQLVHPGLPLEFPPLAGAGSAHNLPVAITTFVGRTDEMRRVADALQSERLVTLAGAGGCGKTRLALEASREQLSRFPHGAWLVELASLNDPALVPDAVAGALRLGKTGRDTSEAIVAYLAERTALLVLDNCEHLIEACASIAARILSSCTDVRILTTSREALRLPGETTIAVEPFPLPSLEAPLEPTDAMILFRDRAASVGGGFALTEQNAHAVARICHLLDGIPLALELAAARTTMLTPTEIADRLTDRFGLLNTGPRTAPERHRTLRGVIEWGYELLADDERRLFRRLAVFPATFSLEQAESICSGEDLARRDVLDVLSRLVDKSAVAAVSRDGDARYRMLETVRTYAAERLREAKEGRAVRDAHLGWCSVFADRASSQIQGPMQQTWLPRLDDEIDNLRAALAWSIQADPAAGLAMAIELVPYWNLRGSLREQRAWLDATLAATSEPDPIMHSDALRLLGLVAWEQGEVALGRSLLDQALRLAHESGDELPLARVHLSLGQFAHQRADYDEAERSLTSSLEVFRRHDQWIAAVGALTTLGHVRLSRHDTDAARGYYEEGLSIVRGRGGPHMIGTAALNLGNIEVMRRDFEAARPHFEEALETAREIGDARTGAVALRSLGWCALEAGDAAAAREAAQEALEINRELGHKPGVATTMLFLGEAQLHLGDLAAARGVMEESLAMFRQLAMQPGVVEALNLLGAIARAAGDTKDAIAFYRDALVAGREGNVVAVPSALEGLAATASDDDPERAALLLGAAEAVRRSISATVRPAERSSHEQLLARVREALGDEVFDRAWSAGAGCSIDDAVSLGAA